MHPQLARSYCRRIASAGLLGLALSVVGSLGSVASAQTTSASLASYVPNRDLVVYLEFAGLDSETAAWKGTAMYKVLNETKTGIMLEDLLAQVLDKKLKQNSRILQRMTGTEIVALAETILKSGFVVGLGGKPGDVNAGYGVIVFRNAFRKDTKALFGKVVASLNTPTTKASLATKANHKVVAIVDSKTGPKLDWWVDDRKKEDLIISLNPVGTASILETIDGTQPSAVDNKLRSELVTSAVGVTPMMTAFADASILNGAPIPPALGIDGLKRIDYVWGFQGKETVSITRIIAPKPRKGVLALFDQPTFEKGKMLAVPEGVEGFTVMSVDAGKVFDDLLALAQSMNPQAEAQVKAAIDQIKTKSKIHLKEDVLAQIGPKIAVYSAPASKSSGSGFNPLAAFTGGADIPKLTIVAEIQNPAAFARTLDALMIEVNKQLRAATPAAPGAAGADEAATPKKKADSGRPVLEFKLLPSTGTGDRGYMMSIPSQLASFLPSHVRPTIRLHGKTLVISVAPDAARQAAELKGPGAAAKEFAETLQPINGELVALSIDDPRATLPALLASLPGKAQALANRSAAPAGLPAAGGPGVPGAVNPGGPGAPGEATVSATGPGRGGRTRDGLSVSGAPGGGIAPGPVGAPIAPGGGPSGYPQSTGPGGQPGPAGAPGGGAAAGGGGTGVIFTIDAAKMPKADEIKPFLFPSSFSVVVEDQGLRFITRESFPNITPLFSIPALGSLPGMGGPGGPPPGGTPPPGFGPAGAPGGPGAPGGGGGGRNASSKVVD